MIANETLITIKQRRSIRSFKTEQIKEEELQAVLEAGQYAPYTWEQGRHFTVIQNKELLDRLNHIAKKAAMQLGIEDLKEIAGNEEYNCIYSAPTLIIISGNEQSPVPLDADCAAAAENLLLAAESIGLGSCWIYFVMFAFNSPQGLELRKEFGIPEDCKPYYSVALGYKHDKAAEAPERKPNPITYIR